MALTKTKSMPLLLQDSNKSTLIQKMKLFVSNITVEPVIVLYMVSSATTSLAIQNLTLEKACRVNVKLNEEKCDALASRNLTAYTKEEDIMVQKLVASMYAWKVVLQCAIPAMLLLFLGSWSDRHGRRKPFILFPILGEVVTCVGFLLCTYFFYELPMEVNAVAEALPPALTGGLITLFMASFSYFASVCSFENTTERIGIVHILIELSVTLGTALSGVLFTATGFYGVFSLCLVLHVSAAVCAFFLIKEKCPPVAQSVELKNVETTQKGLLKDMFDLKRINETFLAVFKKGANSRKMRVFSIFVLVLVISGPIHGEMGVMYLYLRYRFHWTEIDYSIYATYKVILHLCGTSFGLVFFSKVLKLDDSILGAIASTSRFLACFVYAFAPNVLVFYLGAVVEILGGMTHIAMRSIIAKLVPTEELGKVNSLFGVSEALVPIIYGPMYSMLYKATINILPGTFLLAGGVLTFPALLIFIWLFYQHLQDEKDAMKNEAVKEGLLEQKSEK